MGRSQRIMAFPNKYMATLQQSKIQVKKVAFYFRILDYFLWPFMWILAKGKVERPQETHHWHIQNVDCSTLVDIISPALTVVIKGDDSSRFATNSFGLFHLPLLGGWKNYIILEAEVPTRYWHVGWRIYDEKSDTPERCQVQKLCIFGPRIKLLKGLPGKRVEVFGVDSEGGQVLVRQAGEGKLGDGRFRGVRLF